MNDETSDQTAKAQGDGDPGNGAGDTGEQQGATEQGAGDAGQGTEDAGGDAPIGDPVLDGTETREATPHSGGQ